VNGTETLIAITYGAVTVIGVVIAVLIAASTRSRRSLDEHKAAEGERAWLYVMIATLAALLVATIWFVPYGASDAGGHVVKVRAQQFAWQVVPARFPVHQKIVFVLTSKDVNHDFGIYDDRGHFVVQIQVVPGDTQKLVHTFDRPGTYQILCLEFCGLGHHLMQGSFVVTP
jgi:cytochrome c oxidase subunit 2